MDTKNLLLSLIKANAETDVADVINKHPILKNEKNWRPYGTPNNIGTITGQNPEAIPSLSEKITNSLDAILIKACIENGDDPKGENSPNSMAEALKKYFNLDDEKYEELSDAQRRKLAKKVQILAEGEKGGKTNIIIYDEGEGQHPQKFPDTFLSLSADNKGKVFFVQGKYNMGGSAVLPFCGDSGETGYQLILSKKNLSKDNMGNFGFTLMRRNWGEGKHVKSSRYEYCVDEQGKIFEFSSNPLDLGLFETLFAGGTYIKLYNYDLPTKTDITLDFWRGLNRYIYQSALPVLLYEKREYGGKTPSKIMHGNRMRARLDERGSLEKSISMSLSIRGQQYPVEVFVFNKEVQPREFIGGMPIVFSVNGQVQHYLGQSFISSKAKKAYLKSSMLVHVDCSDLPSKLHERIFMSNRAQMRDVIEYRELLDALAKELRDNETLRAIDDTRQKDAVYQNPKDEAFLKNIIGRLLRDDKEIERLLGLSGDIIGTKTKEIKKEQKGDKKPFRGERHPSVFRFKNLKPGQYKMLPQNGECRIQIETDVEDEYLMRSHEKGELNIKIQVPRIPVGPGPGPGPKPSDRNEDVLEVNRVGPNNGTISLRIKPTKELPVGTSVPIDIEMSSPNGPFQLTALVKIDNPHGKTDEKNITTKQQYSLPALTEVYKERPTKEQEDKEAQQKYWLDCDPVWTEAEICRIQESSRQDRLVDTVEINMDAKELHSYIKSKKITGKNVEKVTRTYKTSVYLISIVLYNELFQRKKKLEESRDKYSKVGEEFEPADLAAFMMNGMAKILLHVTTNESLLKEMEE